MDSSIDYWSLDWFAPSTLRAFTWTNTFFLYLILAVPFLLTARWLWRYFFNQKLAVAFSKGSLTSSPLTLLRLLPEFLLGLVVILVLVALARPQKTNEKVEQWAEGIDIMLAIDISQSMQIE